MYERLQSTMVKVVGYVDPPYISHGVTSAPHSWASSAQDKLKDVKLNTHSLPNGRDSRRCKLEAVTWDEKGGLAAVLRLPFRAIWARDAWRPEPFWSGIALCARVDYYLKFDRTYGFAYAEEEIAYGLNVLHYLGCNARAATVMPQAAHITRNMHSVLEREYDEEIRKQAFKTRIIPNGEELFPNVDFSVNAEVQKEIHAISGKPKLHVERMKMDST